MWSACSAPAPTALPGGIDLTRLPPTAELRATLAIDEVLPDEQELVVDRDDGTVAGEVTLVNVAAAGQKPARLRLYGSLTDETAEVLLGEAVTVVDVRPGGATRLAFDGVAFDVCGGAPCALRFDDNRNGRSNVDDLYEGVDPASQPPFLRAADTLQFASGVRLGTFARQVLVVENTAPHPVRLTTAQVAGGQGIGLSTYEPGAVEVAAPRRLLDEAFFDVDDDGRSDLVVAPGEEAFFAVTFAPANLFLTTASINVVAVDTVTLVQQSGQTRVIANADGALRPADPTYAEPATVTALTTAGGTVRAVPFPTAELFSGVEITGVDDPTTRVREEAPLAFTGSTFVVGDQAIPADVAFIVDVAPGQRFAAALSGLVPGSDIDLAVVDVTAADVPAIVQRTSLAGTSAEAIEFANEGALRRVAVLLGRIERAPPPAATGALSVDEPAPFRLTCQLTEGPVFDDVEPVAPAHGPLEGGIPLVLRGTGFFVPRDPVAGPHVRVTVDGVVVVGTPQVATDAAGGQTLTVVLPRGGPASADRPVNIVVENPTSPAGDNGDGQAATLAEGFRYDLPKPRLDRLVPDRTVTTGDQPIVVQGAFFFDVHGRPVVSLGGEPLPDEAVTFVDAATVRVLPGARAAGALELVVQSRQAATTGGDTLGLPSNALTLQFVVPTGPAPRVDSVSPGTGSTLGGDTVTVAGASFDAGAQVFFGANAATVVTSTSTELVVVSPPSGQPAVVDVLVVNADGQAAVAAGAFAWVLPPPAIAAVSPSRVPSTGGTPLTVTGSGFAGGLVATFTAAGTQVPVTVTVSSSTRLGLTSPPLPPGSATLTLSRAGQTASVPLEVFAPAGPAPRIVGMDPSSGDVAGGVEVVLTGADLDEPQVVLGTQILPTTRRAAAAGLSALSFVTPSSPAGPVTVTVVNRDGQSDAQIFTFVEGVAPAIFAVSPTVLHAEVGGDDIVVFGERLDRVGLPLNAEAAVTDDEGVTTTTALRVTAVADALVRATVEDPLPAGVVRVTLRGPAGAVVGPPVTARPPEVTQLQLDLGKPSPDALLFGENLAGDRLVGLAIGGTACDSVIADERLAVCALSGSAAATIASRADRTLTLAYADGSRVARVAASELVRGNAPASSCGNGALEAGEGCDDGNANDGDGCSSACRAEVPAP